MIAAGAFLPDSAESTQGRRAIRRAWRCDCDGVSHTRPGRPVMPIVEAHGRRVEHEAGMFPDTCPWRTFEDPLVKEVLSFRRAIKSGVANTANAPAEILEGVRVFESALDACEAARRKRDDDYREAEHKAKEARRGR